MKSSENRDSVDVHRLSEMMAHEIGDLYIDHFNESPVDQWLKVMRALRAHGYEISFSANTIGIVRQSGKKHLDVYSHPFVLWRNERIAEALQRGDEFFIGLPKAWYEPPTWACVNGHVSARYIKSRQLLCDVCPECQTSIWLIPGISEAQLAKILSENTNSTQ
jgi:hypothetical protein